MSYCHSYVELGKFKIKKGQIIIIGIAFDIFSDNKGQHYEYYLYMTKCNKKNVERIPSIRLSSSIIEQLIGLFPQNAEIGKDRLTIRF